MSLIHTLIIAQPSSWQRKDFIIFITGLMTEHGILLEELLEVRIFYFRLLMFVCLYVHSYLCTCLNSSLRVTDRTVNGKVVHKDMRSLFSCMTSD